MPLRKTRTDIVHEQCFHDERWIGTGNQIATYHDLQAPFDRPKGDPLVPRNLAKEQVLS
jgi:hypothetical protein